MSLDVRTAPVHYDRPPQVAASMSAPPSVSVLRRAGDTFLPVAATIPVLPLETIRLLAQGFVPLTQVTILIIPFGFTATVRVSGNGNGWIDTSAPPLPGGYVLQARGRTSNIPIIGIFQETIVNQALLVSADAPPPPEEPPQTGGGNFLDQLKTLAIIGAVIAGVVVLGPAITKAIPQRRGE